MAHEIGSTQNPVIISDNQDSAQPDDNKQLQLLSHEDFRLLSPFNQQEYFNKISEALHHWQNFGDSCPRIDKFILSHYDKDNRLTTIEQETAARIQENFEQKWALDGVPLTDSALACEARSASESVSWLDDDLRWNAVSSQFELESTRNSRLCYHYDIDSYMRQHGLAYHISSPLLLYRINLLTGNLKGITTDRYKCSWDITFRHLETRSTLRFWDSKGGVRASFSGAKKVRKRRSCGHKLSGNVQVPPYLRWSISGSIGVTPSILLISRIGARWHNFG